MSLLNHPVDTMLFLPTIIANSVTRRFLIPCFPPSNSPINLFKCRSAVFEDDFEGFKKFLAAEKRRNIVTINKAHRNFSSHISNPYSYFLFYQIDFTSPAHPLRNDISAVIFE